MKRLISKNKKYLGYILYAILLMIVLLYYRFPSDAFCEYLEATAEKVAPPLLLSVENVQPSLSLGLRFLGTELSLKKDPHISLFNAESLLIRPEIWSLLKGEFEFCFDCLAYSGDVKGCVHLGEHGIKGPFSTSIELQDLRIDDHAHLSSLIGRDVKGVLDGTITYRGQGNLLIAGTGEADLRISEGQIELLEPILGGEPIDFDELRIKMVIKNRRIDLRDVELMGRALQATLSGSIRLKTELLESNLNIRGTIEPLAGFFESVKGSSYTNTLRFLRQRLKKGKLSFIIHGTLNNPGFRFI